MAGELMQVRKYGTYLREAKNLEGMSETISQRFHPHPHPARCACAFLAVIKDMELIQGGLLSL